MYIQLQQEISYVYAQYICARIQREHAYMYMGYGIELMYITNVVTITIEIWKSLVSSLETRKLLVLPPKR